MYEDLGYNFKIKREVQVLEANYGPYVLEMRQEGIEYVSMVGDFQSISRFLKAMRQQNYFPTVREWDSVAYDPDFLDSAGPAAEDSRIYLNTNLFEEINSNKEMQLYAGWLNRVAPGAEPDYFGLYAWSAGRLFVKAATDVGPKLTREKLMAVLKKHPFVGRIRTPRRTRHRTPDPIPLLPLCSGQGTEGSHERRPRTDSPATRDS